MGLYDQDFYKWTQEQAALLKAGEFSRLDVVNLAEEIESMGKNQKKELISRLTILLMHLLKLDYQQKRKSKSWLKIIATQRTEIEFLLYDNATLKHELPELLTRAYRAAVKQAATETGIKIGKFPFSCPFTMNRIMEE